MTAPLPPSSGWFGRAPSLFSARARPTLIGTAAGVLAALIWATYMVAAKAGTDSGLLPQDFAALRFGTAAVIMLPWLLRHDWRTLGGVSWWRGIVLTLLAGPPFILLGTGGYLYAPLAHGAVIQPSTIALAGMLAAAVLFKERTTLTRLIGVALIITGLVVIASHATAMGGGMVWIGDLLFIAAGLSWAAFTILIQRWQLNPLAVTAAVSVLSALAVLPALLTGGGPARIAALPLRDLIAQVIVQGALSGVVAVIAFGLAVRHLGAARAAMFPAMVPAATLVVGVIATGAVPTPFEWSGAGLATLGLLAAIGLVRLPFTSPRLPTPAQGAAS